MKIEINFDIVVRVTRREYHFSIHFRAIATKLTFDLRFIEVLLFLDHYRILFRSFRSNQKRNSVIKEERSCFQ